MGAMANSMKMNEAKRHLSRLVERLLALRTRTSPRQPGLWRGLVHLAPDFDEPDEQLIDAFEA